MNQFYRKLPFVLAVIILLIITSCAPQASATPTTTPVVDDMSSRDLNVYDSIHLMDAATGQVHQITSGSAQRTQDIGQSVEVIYTIDGVPQDSKRVGEDPHASIVTLGEGLEVYISYAPDMYPGLEVRWDPEMWSEITDALYQEHESKLIEMGETLILNGIESGIHSLSLILSEDELLTVSVNGLAEEPRKLNGREEIISGVAVEVIIHDEKLLAVMWRSDLWVDKASMPVPTGKWLFQGEDITLRLEEKCDGYMTIHFAKYGDGVFTATIDGHEVSLNAGDTTIISYDAEHPVVIKAGYFESKPFIEAKWDSAWTVVEDNSTC